MIKKILSLLLIISAITFCKTAFAQQNFYDAIYLKNGSVINGIIIEQVPGQTIKVETKDKNVFVFREDEIEKIVKGSFVNKRGRDKPDDDPEPKESSISEPYTGYTFGVETGIGPGTSGRNQNGMGLAAHVINGATINSKFSCGIGIGFDLYTIGYYTGEDETYFDDYSRTYLNMTYYVDVRAFPIKGKVSPLLILNYGYASTMFSSKVTSGQYFSAGVGTKFRITQHFGMNLTVNYKIQKFRYKDTLSGYYYSGNYPYSNYYYQEVDEKFNLEYLNLVIGLSF